MTSHGIPRTGSTEQKSPESQDRERKEIEEYRALDDFIRCKVREADYSPELLDKTAALLKKNPEYYTIWNTRRRIYFAEFDDLTSQVLHQQVTEISKNDQIFDILQLELQFLFPILLKFPKCYWIWNHRLWLLEQSSKYLPAETARKLWQDELGLVMKMLTRDSRNFHGWGYRRIVVQNLESSALNGSSMARPEYDYTTKMIRNNLSNFSAWHNRTRLISIMLDEEHASDENRLKMLDDELSLIHKALFDPYDQSLWFYYQNLMCTFDPTTCSKSLIPDLSVNQKIQYLQQERGFLEDLLEDADDCKWVYLALIQCNMIEGRVNGHISSTAKENCRSWLGRLKELDPLRMGRWNDMISDMS